MSLFRYVKRALAGGMFVALAGAASASTVTSYIDLSGKGPHAASYSFTDGTVNLVTSGHVLNADGSIGAQHLVGLWGGGLGVKTGQYDAHYVDGSGGREVVKFLFDTVVRIEKIWFTYVDTFDRFAFSVLNGASVTQFTDNLAMNGVGTGSYTFANGLISDIFGVGATSARSAFKIKAIEFSYDTTPAPIPVPAAGWLLLAGLGGLAALRRTKRA